MKTIVLMPVKNEAWILETTLKNLSPLVDSIIVADQHSIDDTVSICARFQNVEVIENNAEGHSSKVRQLLLDHARKQEGNNLILCIDADEVISPSTCNKLKDEASHSELGTGFSLAWIQMVSTNEHRIDGVWENNTKPFAFIDDRTSNYAPQETINDHAPRIPVSNIKHIEGALLHFQFAAQKRSQIKQAWYMCSEPLHGGDARKINVKYSVSKLPTKTAAIDMKWIQGVAMPQASAFSEPDTLKLKEVFHFFDTKGIGFFEPLDIWDIPELKQRFQTEIGRVPRPKTFPAFLVTLNTIKNKLKNFK